jgi:rare lipoprotein A
MITQTLASFLASITLGTASVPQPPIVAHASDCGTATYYDPWYQDRETATTGVYYDRYKLSAASWHYPLGTWLRITDQDTGRSIEIEVNDRGGYHLLDLSEEASIRLGRTGQPDNRYICVEVL